MTESLTAQGVPTVVQLRKIAIERQVQVYRVGGQWESAVWDAGMGLWHTRTEHYSFDASPERVVLAHKLGYL